MRRCRRMTREMSTGYARGTPSVYLGDSPGLDAFRLIFVLYLASTLLGTTIAARLDPWPASEDDAHAVVAGR